MKKLVSILAIAGLMASMSVAGMADNGAVPSKTTTETSRVVSVETASGTEATFTVEITEDAETVQQEIAKLYTFVNDTENGGAPIEHFPVETQEKVREQMIAQGAQENFDLKTLELNEFVTLKETGYAQSFGDAKVKLEFVTKYVPGQKLVALLGFYTGELDAEGNPVVVWEAMPVEVLEDGNVVIALSEEQLLAFGEADSVALAMLNEPMVQE